MSDQFHEIDDLIRSGQMRDERFVEVVIFHFYEPLVHLARTIVHDAVLADDAAQETVLTATRKRHQYVVGTNFRAWLFTICVNICRGYLRQHKARQRLQTVLSVWRPLAEKTPSPETVVMQNEADAELWAAVQRLREKHRLPVILRYLHGLSLKEVAEILEVNEGTIRSRLHYAHKQLAQELKRAEMSLGVVRGDTR